MYDMCAMYDFVSSFLVTSLQNSATVREVNLIFTSKKFQICSHMV